MEIQKELVRSREATSVALGYFDGLHRGHRAVIGEAVENGIRCGLVPAVFTLKQSPRVILRGEKSNNIITIEEKLELLEKMGVQRVYLIDFTTIKDITAESFVRDVIVDRFNARHVSCGFNYHFGAGAAGSGEHLEGMCRQYGITVYAKKRIESGSLPISSTRIRGCIVRGDIPSASEMLGRTYGFSLPVVHGRQLGRSIGIPTINQMFPEELVCPPFGVYASRVCVNGKYYCGVTNIGVKPTVGSDGVVIETWMPDYKGRELYGEKTDVRLLKAIREEKKFSGLSQLKDAIISDSEKAKDIYQSLYPEEY